MTLQNRRWLKLRRLVIALAIAATAVTLAAPSRAQFFDDRYPYSGGGGGWRRQQQPQQRDYYGWPEGGFNPFYQPRAVQPIDSTKAPQTRKLENPPTTNVVVIGDSFADWLAYGLDETYADQPDTGVVRKIRAYSGLIHYDAKNDALDWSQALKDLLATEKPNAIVVMLGLNDRVSLREKAPAGQTPPAAPQGQGSAGAKTDSATAPQSPAAATDPQRPVPGTSYEFHTDQWAMLYSKRIDDMIVALKTRGVPILWVGLPAVRGTKSTSDMSYLDELYRERAEKAGIDYVDIWDGFVDEQGRYAVQGPDFEGQIRRLRTPDGVHFTKAGAVKLASYVDRDLRRAMANHVVPVALPSTEETGPAKSGAPGRPAVGPVLPLTASGGETGDLAGGGRPAQSTSDPLATRVLSRGDPIAAPSGRADDFSWPHPDASSTPDEAPEPVALAPATAKKGAAGRDDGKKSSDAKSDSKKDAKSKPSPDSSTAKTRRPPSANLDGAPVPPAPVGAATSAR